MRLTGIAAGNSVFNAAAINQKVNRQNNDDRQQTGLAIQLANRDTLSISGQGKKQNIIQQLMNQKQLIQESKDAEMKRGLENGYVNQDKIDEYNEQLEMLDKQIAEEIAKQAAGEVEEQDSKLSDSKKVMTEEEYEQRRMMDVLDLSSGMEQTETVSSAKEKMDGEARVLKAEIELDGANGRKALESKRERVQEIEARSSDLMEQIGEKIADINETVTESTNRIPVDDGTDEDEASALTDGTSVKDADQDS